MKEVCFPNWERALEEANLPASTRRSFAITIRWYPGYCRRTKGRTTHQSARDFIEWVVAEVYGTVQELMGHAKVETTQIYTHVLNRPGMGAKSPLDL